jgi:hypothetical protein
MTSVRQVAHLSRCRSIVSSGVPERLCCASCWPRSRCSRPSRSASRSSPLSDLRLPANRNMETSHCQPRRVQALAYVCFEDELSRRAAANLLPRRGPALRRRCERGSAAHLQCRAPHRKRPTGMGEKPAHGRMWWCSACVTSLFTSCRLGWGGTIAPSDTASDGDWPRYRKRMSQLPVGPRHILGCACAYAPYNVPARAQLRWQSQAAPPLRSSACLFLPSFLLSDEA